MLLPSGNSAKTIKEQEALFIQALQTSGSDSLQRMSQALDAKMKYWAYMFGSPECNYSAYFIKLIADACLNIKST